MINQWIGLAISYLFIFGAIGIAQLMLRFGVLTPAATRKIVHIAVAHWWIIAIFFIDDLSVALIGPVSFIVINWISYRNHLFSAMEHENSRKNLGTIYFPIALTILVFLTWGGVFPKWYGLVAILVLGWGDGSASLFGEWIGHRPRSLRFSVPGGTKSVIGTVAMFVASGFVAGSIVFLVTGIDTKAVIVSPPLVSWVERILAVLTPTGWVAQPTDSAVLIALSRLDGIVRIAATHVASRINDATASGIGTIDLALWRLEPTTIVAIAFVVAAIATAVELVTPWGLDNITIPLTTIVVLPVLLALPQVITIRLAWAVGLNILVAVGAYLKRSVTAGGALAGAAVGIPIYLSGGGFYWSILMAFFFSSTVLGKIKPRAPLLRERHERIVTTTKRIHAKGSRRDAVQVLANGGLGATMAVLHAVTGRPIFMLGFAISIAAANADTWASEIGVMSKRPPISIFTWRPIERGTSGGISTLGLFASAFGALFIALWFGVGYIITRGWNALEVLPMIAAITGGGFLGSLVDSVLGATVQAQYWDKIKEGYTERRINIEGAANHLVRGFHVMNNDAVNALSGLVSITVLFGLVV